MMDRRTVISAIALATVCARSGAFAQQQRSWRVGFVALPERPEQLEGSRFGAFALGMRELGYIERRNLPETRRQVRLVPKADKCTAAKKAALFDHLVGAGENLICPFLGQSGQPRTRDINSCGRK